MITVEFNNKLAKQWIDDIAQSQIPFATALALTNTTAKINAIVSNKANSNMKVKKKGYFSAVAKKLNAKNLPQNSAFVSCPANAKDPIAKMITTVGITNPLVSQQAEGNIQTRTSISKKDPNLWVPMNKTKSGTNARRSVFDKLSKAKSKIFVKKSKSDSSLMVLKRFGSKKNSKLELLYKTRKSQKIKPLFSFYETSRKLPALLFPKFFKLAMLKAIKNARY